MTASSGNTWEWLTDMRKNNDYYFDKYVEVTCKDSWKKGWKKGWNKAASETMAKLDAAIEEEGLSRELATKLREAICFAD